MADPAQLRAIATRYPGAIWVHGGAAGFDRQVAAFAAANGIVTDVLQPNFARYGRAATLIRDRAIVDTSECLYACYDGRRYGGTYYTISHAKRAGKPVHLLTPVKDGKGH